MLNCNNHIAEAKERVEQLKRQRRLQENRETEQQRKMDTRLKIIVGGVVVKHFPGVSRFKPKLNKADTSAEFAELDGFLAAVAADPKFSALFQEIADRKLSEDSNDDSDRTNDRSKEGRTYTSGCERGL